MSSEVLGLIDWKLQIDPDGHRNYSAVWLIEADVGSIADGPMSICAAVGLPQIGDPWIFGNDNDPWAFCWPDWNVTPVLTHTPGYFWTVEQKFTTKPFLRCMLLQILNPVDEPFKISGSFVNYTRETQTDMNGNVILSSSLEFLKGQSMERDYARFTVEIEFNVAPADLGLTTQAIHTLNDAILWGLPTRCVKFSRFNWRRVAFGVCSYYFTLQMGFDCDYNTFDRVIPDEGTLELAPGGNPANPKHFKRIKDLELHATKDKLALDGAGHVADPTHPAGFKLVQFYPTSNLLLLGIPATF